MQEPENIDKKDISAYETLYPLDDSNIRNYAFIDGQNLRMSTTQNSRNPWEVNLLRFRIYLKKKYNVTIAYYFLGYIAENEQKMYQEIHDAGFILTFKEHSPKMISKKKGNVDSDIIFNIMKRLYKREEFENIIIVSGDGDYKILVDFLIKEGRLEKILFPSKSNSSCLYKNIGNMYFSYLDDQDIKEKIAKEKGPED